MVHRVPRILSNTVEYCAVGIGIYLALRSVWERTWLFDSSGPHGILSATMISLFFAYAAVSRCLRVLGAGPVERMAIAAATTLAAIELYELFYNGGFLTVTSFLWLGNSFPYLSVLVQGSTILTVAGFLVLFLLMFTGIRYMRLNRFFYTDLALSLLTFGLWIAVGYPQFFGNGCPNYTNCHPPYALEGYLFNSVSKFFVDLLPATLYVPRRLRSVIESIREDWAWLLPPCGAKSAKLRA